MVKFFDITIKQVLSEFEKPSNGVISVPPSLPLDEAIGLMATNQVLSVPVCPIEPGSKVLGVVNYFNLVETLLKILKDTNSSIKDSTIGQVEEAVKQIEKLKVEDVFQTHAEDTIFLHTHHLSLSLEHVLPNFFRPGFLVAQPSRGPPAHRIYILSKTGRPIQTLSQRDLIKYLNNHQDLLGPLAERSIVELGLFSKDIVCANSQEYISKLVTVQSNQIVLEAYEVLLRSHHSSVAVIDNEGTLVGEVSASDLRGMLHSNLNELIHPLSEWLKGKHIPATCGKDTTLSELLQQMVNQNLTRIYGVEDDGVPISIISCTDILESIYES